VKLCSCREPRNRAVTHIVAAGDLAHRLAVLVAAANRLALSSRVAIPTCWVSSPRTNSRSAGPVSTFHGRPRSIRGIPTTTPAARRIRSGCYLQANSRRVPGHEAARKTISRAGRDPGRARHGRALPACATEGAQHTAKHRTAPMPKPKERPASKGRVHKGKARS
jgi:hypothetical protein